MRYKDFMEFYNLASTELDQASRIEGFLIEKHPTFPITKGQYISSSINHLREAMQYIDYPSPQLLAGLDKLEARYKEIANGDRELTIKLLKDFGDNLGTARSLLNSARKHYFFFRKELEEGYTYEEYVTDTLFHLEITAARLENTEVFPALRLNIGIVKDDLEKILKKDREFHKIAGGFPN